MEEAFSVQKHVPLILADYPGQEMTAREVAELVFERFPDACEVTRRSAKTNLSRDRALISRIASDICSQKRQLEDLGISSWQMDITERPPGPAEARPHRGPRVQWVFSFEPSSKIRVREISRGRRMTSGKKEEKDLYLPLSSFLMTRAGIWSYPIEDAKTCNKRGRGNHRWMFPDMVGLEPLSSQGDPEDENGSISAGKWRCRLWSFEIKGELTSANVQVHHEQADRNSSWAHRAYLVAPSITQGALDELHELTQDSGLGVIKLNCDDPAGSEILISARDDMSFDEGEYLRRVANNRDFVAFDGIVRKYRETGEIDSRDWQYRIREHRPPSEDGPRFRRWMFGLDPDALRKLSDLSKPAFRFRG